MAFQHILVEYSMMHYLYFFLNRYIYIYYEYKAQFCEMEPETDQRPPPRPSNFWISGFWKVHELLFWKVHELLYLPRYRIQVLDIIATFSSLRCSLSRGIEFDIVAT